MQREPRYRIFSQYLKDKYGQKVYKLPVNLPLTCPNRDGTLGETGCTFCGDEAAGFESLSNQIAVDEQLRKNMSYIRDKYNADKFIAYFQNFTNTYLPLDKFEANLREACIEDIVEINVSTRPDCIHDDYLEVMAQIAESEGVNMGVELGLQTVNYHTLRSINRGHTLAEFLDAVKRIQSYGFEICVHMILNLPDDNMEDVIENAKIISALGIEQVKIHSLYILKDTPLGDEYQKEELEMISMEEYIERVITFLEYLDPSIVIQRFFGRAPKERTLFCNWDHHWAQIKSKLDKLMEKRGTEQGRKFNYLGGRGVKKFVK